MIPARLLVLLVLLFTSWWFGAVHERVQVYVFLAIALACVFSLFSRRAAPIRLSLTLLPLLAAVALALFQLVALPKPVASLVSPHTVELRDELLTDQVPVAGVQVGPPAIRYTVSLRPAVTRYDLSLLILSIAGFTLASQLFSTARSRLLLCWVVAVNGAILAFFGLLQKLTWNGQMFWIGPEPSNNKSFATFVNRNNAGGYLNLCLAGAVVLMLWAANRKTRIGPTSLESESLDSGTLDSETLQPTELPFRTDLSHRLANLDALKIATSALAAIIGGGILCTLSRGSGIALMVASIVTALVVVATGRKQLRMGGGLVVVLAGVGLVGWVGLRDAMVERIGTLAEREQLVDVGRVPNWLDALRSVADFWPTGTGLGTYRDVYLLYQDRYLPAWFYYAENQYVQAVVEAGIPGLLLLLLAIATVILAACSLLRSASEPLDYALAIGGLFAVVSEAVHSFFDFGLYLPANLLLMAVLCGVVTQRAITVSGSKHTFAELGCLAGGRLHRLLERLGATGSASAHGHGSMGQECTGRASGSPVFSWDRALVGLLLIGVLWGAWQVRAIAARNTALTEADFSSSPGGASEVELRTAIDTLQARLPRSSDDAELHYRLARAWMYLRRIQVFTELRPASPPSVSIDELWELASATALHRQAYGLVRAGKVSDLETLRSDPKLTESLRPALQHLRLARQACPILSKVHLRLAKICFLDGPVECDAAQVNRARRLAPSSPYTLTECGLLDMQAGRVDSACQSWQHALTLSEDYLEDVLTYAVRDIELETIVNQVLPASPTLLLRVVQQELPGIPVTELKPLLLDRVERMAGEADVPVGERHYLLASVYALRGDRPAALLEYGAAVESRPFEFTWRHEFGQLLFEAGRLDEAHEQIRWCARRQPESLELRRLLESIHKSRLSR